MTKFKAILFDVDNTLYDAEQYFTQSFKDVSKYFSGKYGINENNIYATLFELWKKKTSMYSNLFNDLIEELGIEENEVPKIVKIFNNCNAKLIPYEDVVTVLNALKKENFKLGIITDGNTERQKRKIHSLGLKHFFDIIIYTSETKPKPSTKPYKKAIEFLKEKPDNVIYVGDNPELDFKGAKNVGVVTIRIKRGEFREIAKNRFIDFEINNMYEFLNIIKTKK